MERTKINRNLLARSFQYLEGIEQIQEDLAANRAMGTELLRGHFLGVLAEAYRKTSRFDDGLDALTQALAGAEQREERQPEAEIHRLKGELLSQDQSNTSEAQRCFERAIEIARKQSAKSWELRATTSLARLLAK
jgi:tetratricopeptide (TPR) repeat protein